MHHSDAHAEHPVHQPALWLLRRRVGECMVPAGGLPDAHCVRLVGPMGPSEIA
jgi:hypothetical protein